MTTAPPTAATTTTTTTTSRYEALLRLYHETMDEPGWHEALRPIVADMDALWGRMTDRERTAALTYAGMLYEARINNPTTTRTR